MSQPPAEPRNPLYLLLLITGVLFAITAIAYTVVPVLEEKAIEAGQPPPPSVWRDELRDNGWRWLLGELAALILLGFLSMGLDRYRRMKQEQAAAVSSADAMPRDG